MTYYELVTYLDSLTTKTEILQSDIDYINSKEISLVGERYIRFINQINYLMAERLFNFSDKVQDRLMGDYMEDDELSLLISPLANEINYFKLLLNIKYIREENKKAYIKSIVEENNKILDRFKEFFNSDDDRLNIINSYYLEENNEL